MITIGARVLVGRPLNNPKANTCCVKASVRRQMKMYREKNTHSLKGNKLETFYTHLIARSVQPQRSNIAAPFPRKETPGKPPNLIFLMVAHDVLSLYREQNLSYLTTCKRLCIT